MSMANDFSGDADAVIQAGSIHGDVHLSRARRRFPSPHQLPLGPSAFVNRHGDLGRLDHLLEDDAGNEHRPTAIVSAVAGAPGVGKTALALHWAHRVRGRFPDGELYVDMQGYGPGRALVPEQALDLFLRALDVPADSIPEALGERAALYRSLLDGKRILVLIDNASSSTQVRHLLPASPECCAVVTSPELTTEPGGREGAIRVTLDVLSPGESVQLLGALMGAPRVNADAVSALRVAELCGHLPLALRIVAEHTIEPASAVTGRAGRGTRRRTASSRRDGLGGRRSQRHAGRLLLVVPGAAAGAAQDVPPARRAFRPGHRCRGGRRPHRKRRADRQAAAPSTYRRTSLTGKNDEPVSSA